MKVGEGNGNFLADLAEGVPDEEMRKRWREGRYGKPRKQDVEGWRRLVNRT